MKGLCKFYSETLLDNILGIYEGCLNFLCMLLSFIHEFKLEMPLMGLLLNFQFHFFSAFIYPWPQNYLLLFMFYVIFALDLCLHNCSICGRYP